MNFLDRLSVRIKLWLLAGSLMFIATTLWGAGNWMETRITTQSNELVQTLNQLTQADDKAREAQIEFKTQVQEWKNILVRGHDPVRMAKYQKQFDASEKNVDTCLNELKDMFKQLEIPVGAVDTTLQEHQSLGSKYRAALATWKEGDPLAYRNVDTQLTGIDRPMNEAIGKLAEETFRNSKRIEAREKAEMASVIHFGTILKGGLLTSGLIFGFFIAIAILSRIQRSITEVSQGMERMVAGDFSQTIEVRSQDEMGLMATDFNALLKRFQDLFGQLREASSNVAQGSMELSATASEVAKASGEIAQFADSQRMTSERTATAMTEFSASIQEVSGNVQNSNIRTERMVKAAAEGAHQGEATVLAMRAIQEATQQMVKAVHVIQDLARQTNLLALNAAIEAAKAGQHGSGFAVVAEEVRKLAEHSAGAAKQIADLISQTDEAMREGARTVEATDATIRTIQENIKAVAVASREIGAATEEQGRTSDEVAKQVEASALSTERSAAASTELAHTVEEVNRTAEHLARIAEALSASLAQFKTS